MKRNKKRSTPRGGHRRIMTPGMHDAVLEYAAAVLVGAHKRTLQRAARSIEREAHKLVRREPFIPLMFGGG
jgi:hypothetical protein